jgi:hypothetical protein
MTPDHDTPAQLDDLLREALELAARVNRRLSERSPPVRPRPAPTAPPSPPLPRAD